MEQERSQVIDQILARYALPQSPGAALLVMKNGEPVLMRTCGLANIEQQTPITPSSNFRLASLSKQFTATAIVLLKEDGKLSYDDLLSSHLQGLPAYAKDVRLCHLLSHTSGLPDYEVRVER